MILLKPALDLLDYKQKVGKVGASRLLKGCEVGSMEFPFGLEDSSPGEGFLHLFPHNVWVPVSFSEFQCRAKKHRSQLGSDVSEPKC